MATYEFDQSEGLEGGGFLAKPGTFHIIVTGVDPEPVTKDGKAMEGLKVNGTVLDGTEPSEKEKEIEFMLWAPKATDKNNGEMAKRKLTRFSYATGFIASHAPGQKVVIDCEACEGRQIVAKFSEQERDGKKRVELNYSDIYHVDDPAVADIPKSAEALAAIPKTLRKVSKNPPPDSNAASSSKPNPSGSPSRNGKQMATVGAPNLDDV